MAALHFGLLCGFALCTSREAADLPCDETCMAAAKGYSPLEDPAEVGKAMGLPLEISERLRSLFGEKRTKGLMEKGMWPPILVDYNLSEMVPASAAASKHHDDEISRYAKYNPSGKPIYNLPEEPISPDFVTLSRVPRVEYAPRFLKRRETAYIKRLVQKGSGQKYRRRAHGYSKIADFPVGDPVVARVVSRVMKLVGIHNVQPVKAMKYPRDGFAGQHVDFAPQFFDDPNKDMVGYRTASAFLYLTDVAVGGHTGLPAANMQVSPLGNDPDANVRPEEEHELGLAEAKQGCRAGLRIRAIEGALSIFYSRRPDGASDPWSVHLGCPPVSESKIVAVMWLNLNCTADFSGSLSPKSQTCTPLAALEQFAEKPEEGQQKTEL